MIEVNHHQLLVDDRSAGMRLDVYVAAHFKRASSPEHSRSEIQRLIDGAQITLNGATTKASARIRANDRIDIRLPPRHDRTICSEPLPLAILYEDGDWIVINKAPGITVHPAAGHWSGTLVNALLHHCPDIDGIGGVRRPGIVHRLDKDTSGVMIVAKNMVAYNDLVRQFQSRSVEKEYLALAWGNVLPDKGAINRPIGRHRSDRKRMSSVFFSKPSREALTEWVVERRWTFDAGARVTVSLLRVRIHTGRTHQIRVHLADTGYPLVGDRVYGRRRKAAAKNSPIISALETFPRQALHAETLIVRHLRTEKAIKFKAVLPDDFTRLLEHLCSVEEALPKIRQISSGG
jgi:23S rRNA pseudouridine1911/1915/1917 synthase